MRKDKKKKSSLPATIIIPMRNAATTVEETLKTIVKQTYPIREIIVVDNVSKDNSRDLVLNFSSKSKIPITLIRQKIDKGVSSSYNLGAKKAKSHLIVFLTSDCSLPTNKELEKLTKPLRDDKEVVASYSTCILPRFVWEKYNFWEKYFAQKMVDNKSSLMVLKFDCIRKEVFLRIGGFDEVNFGGDSAIGGEDADLNMRLRNEGRIVRSKADSLHLHYISSDYTLFDLLRSRKMYARSIGRFLRKSACQNPFASIIFLIRPTLSILPFLPFFFIPGIALLFLYSFFYSKKMFTTKSTLTDVRIITIPFLNILFLYYELFWMAEAFFTAKSSRSYFKVK